LVQSRQWRSPTQRDAWERRTTSPRLSDGSLPLRRNGLPVRQSTRPAGSGSPTAPITSEKKFDINIDAPTNTCRINGTYSEHWRVTMTVEQERTGAAPAPTGPLSTIDYTERIPNNVNLAGDRRL